MSTTYKKSVLIPLSTYKAMLQRKEGNKTEKNVVTSQNEVVSHEKGPIIERQEELLKQRLYDVSPYSVLSTNQNIQKNAPSTGYIDTLHVRDVGVGIPIVDILSRIRGAQVPNIRSILRKMLELDIVWDKEGEISIESKVIPNSNIISVMRYFSNPSIIIEPTGTEIIWKYLSKYVPKSWFKNKPKIGKRRIITPHVSTPYPMEETEMEYLREKYNKVKEKLKEAELSDASDDEFSETERDEMQTKKQEYTIPNKIISDIQLKKTPTPKFTTPEQSTPKFTTPQQSITPQLDTSYSMATPKLDKSYSLAVSGSPAIKQPKIKSLAKVKSIKSAGKYPAAGEDIFGKKESRGTTSYVSRSGRPVKKNPRYDEKEWDGKWKSKKN